MQSDSSICTSTNSNQRADALRLWAKIRNSWTPIDPIASTGCNCTMKSTVLLSPAFPPEKKIYLQPVIIAGVEVDICPLSGGIWFDRFEVKKFDEVHEDLSELEKALPKNPIPPEQLHNRRSPRHPEAIMQQMPYGPKGANGVLTVDKCPVTAGIWLDYQELRKIRELYPSEAEKKKAISDFVHKALPDSKFPSKLNPQRESFMFRLIKHMTER